MIETAGHKPQPDESKDAEAPRGKHTLSFEFGEPDEQGATFIDEVRRRGRELSEQGEPSAYLQAMYEKGQEAIANGYEPGQSTFMDALFVATHTLMETEGRDAVLAMMIESITVPPAAQPAA